jgi:hypothetical protein
MWGAAQLSYGALEEDTTRPAPARSLRCDLTIHSFLTATGNELTNAPINPRAEPSQER